MSSSSSSSSFVAKDNKDGQPVDGGGALMDIDEGNNGAANDNEMLVVVVDDEPAPEDRDMLRNFLLQAKHNAGSDSLGTGHESDEGKRKLTKPMIEKRRRERMNRCLDYLKQIIIDSKQNVPFLNINKTRFEKADILEITVQYIIGKQYEEYRQQLKGFDMCFNELGKLVLETKEAAATAQCDETGLHNKLRNHLSLHDSAATAPAESREGELLALFKHMCVVRDQLSYECELQRQHAASLVNSLMKKEMGNKLRSNSMSDGELSSPMACSTPTAATSAITGSQLAPDSEKEFLGKLYKLYHETEIPKASLDAKSVQHTGVIRHTNETGGGGGGGGGQWCNYAAAVTSSSQHGKPMDLSSSASSTSSTSSTFSSASSFSSTSSASSTHSSSSTNVEPSTISLSGGGDSSHSTLTHRSPFFTEPKNGFWPRFSYGSYASATGNERNSGYETLWKPYEP